MYRYDDCGLKNIWLKNGFTQHQTKHGEGVSFHDLPGLHRAIGQHLATHTKRLSSAEIRFLRVEMGMSQKRLSDALGVDEQSVSLWERSKRRPTVAAERLLRLFYLEYLNGKTAIATLIDQWNETDRQEEAPYVFTDSKQGWKLAA